MISQETAYGTSKMKLESGVELVIPKPIRKLIPARIIAQYLAICEGSGQYKNFVQNSWSLPSFDKKISSKSGQLHGGRIRGIRKFRRNYQQALWRRDGLVLQTLPKAGLQHTCHERFNEWHFLCVSWPLSILCTKWPQGRRTYAELFT